MVMDVRKTIILAKIETVYDTDPSPVATVDAILASNVTITETSSAEARGEQWKSLDSFPSVLGEQYAEIKFSTAVMGSGVAGTAPRLGVMLKASAHSETIISNTSVTYAPISQNHQSATFYIYMDGQLQIFTGCRGTGKAMFSAGKIISIEWTFMGRYAAPATIAFPATVTYETTAKLPLVAKSSLFTYNALTALTISEFTMDFGNKVVNRPSLNDPNAIKGFEIVGRKCMVTIDPERQAIITSFNFRSDWLTTTRAVSVVGTRSAGNIMTINVPQFNITKVTQAARNEFQIEKLEGEASALNGDDSYSIVFT